MKIFDGNLMDSNDLQQPPSHLREATQAWWSSVVADYALDEHHLKLLQSACECWDRAQLCRELLRRHGLTYEDRFKQPRARPEAAIERDARTQFVRCLRELALDIEGPEAARPPLLPGRRAS